MIEIERKYQSKCLTSWYLLLIVAMSFISLYLDYICFLPKDKHSKNRNGMTQNYIFGGGGGGGVIIQFIFAIDQMKYNFKPDILNKKWFLLIKSITGPLA